MRRGDSCPARQAADGRRVACKRKRARKRARCHASFAIPSAIAIELALLGDAFERFARTFDAILQFIALRRQQFDNFERAARAKPAKWASRVADILTYRILMGL
jgi:hypothetical protein